MAELRADPAAAATRLATALQTDPAAKDFKDLQSLIGKAPAPEFADWIATFKTGAAAPPVPPHRQPAARWTSPAPPTPAAPLPWPMPVTAMPPPATRPGCSPPWP